MVTAVCGVILALVLALIHTDGALHMVSIFGLLNIHSSYHAVDHFLNVHTFVTSVWGEYRKAAKDSRVEADALYVYYNILSS